MAITEHPEYDRCLKYLSVLPWIKNDPELYTMKDCAEWAREKLRNGGLSQEEERELVEYERDRVY